VAEVKVKQAPGPVGQAIDSLLHVGRGAACPPPRPCLPAGAVPPGTPPAAWQEALQASCSSRHARRLASAAVAPWRQPSPSAPRLPSCAQAAHNTLTGVESLRVAAGAGSNTKVAPTRVADYRPCASDEGGFFDDKNRARKQALKAK
jgi:hypothetical protein